jgi:hypothetical protein
MAASPAIGTGTVIAALDRVVVDSVTEVPQPANAINVAAAATAFKIFIEIPPLFTTSRNYIDYM